MQKPKIRRMAKVMCWVGATVVALPTVSQSAPHKTAMAQDQVVNKGASPQVQAVDETVPSLPGGMQHLQTHAAVQGTTKEKRTTPRIEPAPVRVPARAENKGVTTRALDRKAAEILEEASDSAGKLRTTGDTGDSARPGRRTDLPQVRAALRQARGDEAPTMRLEDIRAKIQRELPHRGVESTQAPLPLVPQRARDLPRQPPQKLPQLTATELAAQAKPKKTAAPCKRERRIQELQEKVAEATSPMVREHRMLVLGANHFGAGNLGEAERVYKELLATSSDPTVLYTVRRNLRVLDKHMAIFDAETPVQREQLELELAELHRDLGHAQAAKRICKQLAAGAQQPEVKSEAQKILKTGLSLKPQQHIEFLESIKRTRQDPEGKTEDGVLLEEEGGAR